MKLSKSRVGVHLTITTVILLILAILFLIVFGMPMLQRLRQGLGDIYSCPGECRDSCPDQGWRHERWADGDCKQDDSAQLCCVQTIAAGSSVARNGDIQILYNGDEMPNGATATLVPRSKRTGDQYWVEGKFTVKVSGDAEDQQCYWKVGDDNWEEYLHCKGLSKTKLFSNIFGFYKTFSKSDKDACIVYMTGLQPCKNFETTETAKIMGKDFIELLGERMRLDLVAVDKDCEGDFTLCDDFTQTIFVQVPDQRAEIKLFKGTGRTDTQVSKTKVERLSTGDTHDFRLVIDGPLQYCSLNVLIPLTDSHGVPLTGTDDPEMLDELATLQKKYESQKGCFGLEREERFSITLPDDGVKGIPFEVNVKTWLEGDKPRSSLASYRFLIEPEQKVTVRGPSPGLQREKSVDITCNDVGCGGTFEVAYINNPLDCKKGFEPSGDEAFSRLTNLMPYGTPANQKSGQWRFPIKTEEHNGRYLCVRANTDEGAIYTLGLWDDLPTKVSIDRTKPLLDMTWHIFEGYLEMHCTDQQGSSGEHYMSGCGAKPFSYAYITNPLLFVSHIATGGMLDGEWSGCPDPENGNWAMMNREDNQWPYISSEIRVICVRAQDNAGNWAVGSKVLFNGQDALAMLMRQYAIEGS